MHINGIDLRQLRYFVAVAEELHFGRAARHLNMSQPPLSQQIKALEDFLDVRLFERTNRRVTLTPAGQFLLPEARRIVQDMAQVALLTKQAEAGLTGRLRVGVSFSAPFHPVTSRLLQKFHELYPQVQTELVLHERPDAQQLLDIQALNIDVAILWLDEAHRRADILRFDLARDDVHVILPPIHPLAKKKSVHVRELVGQPIIAQPRFAGTQLYDCIVRSFATIKERPNILYDAHQMPLAMSMVAAGQGLSLMPAFLRDLPIKGVVFRPLVLPRGKTPSMTLNLISATSGRSAAAENFIALARLGGR